MNSPAPTELLKLAAKLDSARHSRIIHGVNVDLTYQEMDMARDALRLAASQGNTALAKGLSPSPMAIEVIVTEAMQDSWNDICADTGCHPLDIKQLGKRRLEFHVSHWARNVGKRVAAALSPASLPPASGDTA
jgi:hypothetical protein